MSRGIRAAGIDDPRITGHSLRRFFGSSLSRADVEIRVLQELMGHELVTSTQVYTQIDRTQKIDALTHSPMVDAPQIVTLAQAGGYSSLTVRRGPKGEVGVGRKKQADARRRMAPRSSTIRGAILYRHLSHGDARAEVAHGPRADHETGC